MRARPAIAAARKNPKALPLAVAVEIAAAAEIVATWIMKQNPNRLPPLVHLRYS